MVKVYIVAILAISVLSLTHMYYSRNVAIKEYPEIVTTVLVDRSGRYTCKLNSTLGSADFDTYKEAEEYCNRWRANLSETYIFRNRDWKEVKR